MALFGFFSVTMTMTIIMWAFVMVLLSFFYVPPINNFVLDHLHPVIARFRFFSVTTTINNSFFRFLSGTIKNFVLNHLYLALMTLFPFFFTVIFKLFNFFPIHIKNFLWDRLKLFVQILPVGSNVKALTREFDILEMKLMDVQKEIEMDEASMKEPTEEVKGWMKRVEALQPSVESVANAYADQSYLRNIHSISMQAVNKLKEVRQEANFIGSVRAYTRAAPLPSVQLMPATPVEFGRERFESRLQEAVNFLRDDNQGVLGIWGMGGVGKTTLLEHINNTLEKSSSSLGFDKVVFATASRESTPDKIRTDLAKKLGMPQGVDQIDVFSYLSNRSFAILLDDVWERQDLKEVGVPLPLGVVGEQKLKRKLILTTRSLLVCNKMGAQQTINVECLSAEDARLLFRHNASVDATMISNNSHIGELADKVADECGGLPIALITTGQALAGTETVQVWDNALQLLRKSKLSQIPGMDEDPLPLLKVSYDHLKDPREKECLLHCALWPEDHAIPKDDLIQCWMGHGLLGKSGSIQGAYNIGHAIIDSLLKVCLLENLRVIDEYTLKNDRVKLHDVIRDMALWIARGCTTVENDEKWVVLHGDQVKTAPLDKQTWSEAHKMSFMFTQIFTWPSEVQNCPNLTTLIIRQYFSELENMSILKHLPSLKYLDLSHCDCIKDFPIEICGLHKLEYLNLAFTRIRALPEELKNLTNLKYLLLQDTTISTVPAELLSNLASLLELDLYHPYIVLSQSSIIDHLDCLEGRLVALGINASSLLDFEKLIRLSSVSIRALCIRKMEDLATPFLGLLSPNLLGSQNICSSLKTLSIKSLGESIEELVMEEKCHLMALNYLTIKFARGLKEIVWKGVEPMEVFQNLRKMSIYDCNHLMHVTWIVNLPCLEHLELYRCYNMKQMVVWEEGAEVEESGRHIFPSLRILEMTGLAKLSCICDHALTFPSLEYLKVLGCIQLRKLPFQSPASCRNLKEIMATKAWWYIVQLEGDMRAFLDPLFEIWRHSS